MAMHLQQQTGIPTVNGYSGQFPKNNWPYAHPSGQGAFRWILRNSSMKIHSMRSVKKAKKRCIITKAYDQNPIIAELNKEDPAKFSIITIASPQKIIYEGGEISIGIKYDHLYYRINSNKISSRWTMLSRDEMTIPANRGQFKIAKATFSVNKNGNEFTVIDRNAIQGIEHIWTINKHTGKLIEQATNIIP